MFFACQNPDNPGAAALMIQFLTDFNVLLFFMYTEKSAGFSCFL
jgi:hypothetical protein